MWLDFLRNPMFAFTFAPDEGSGGSGSASSPVSGDPPPSGSDPAPATPDKNDGEEIHQIPQSALAKRLERAKAEAVSDLLRVMGVDKPEDLQAIVESEKQRRDGELSELQKTQKVLADTQKERDEYRQKYEALVEDVKAEQVANAVRNAARQAHHPEDVIAWARQHAAEDLAAILSADGQINDGKAKAIVAQCQKARPEWFAAGAPGAPSNAGGQGPASLQQAEDIAKTAARQVRSFR